jgi:hypothetical protein
MDLHGRFDLFLYFLFWQWPATERQIIGIYQRLQPLLLFTYVPGILEKNKP